MDKPYSISHTKLATYRRCKQQYHWKYIDHFYPKASVGQVRGSAGHAALGEWHRTYQTYTALDAAWDKWVAEGQGLGEDWDLTVETLERYFAWSRENDTFTILKAEQKFDIIFKDPAIKFTGYIDGIIQEEDGRIWLLENKFNKRVQTSHLDMDIQATIYMLAANLLGHKPVGVLYNIIRVGTKIAEKQPVVRKQLYRNSDGLNHVTHEILLQAKEMIEYDKGGTPYRNPTKDCSWDCPFFAACLNLLDDGIEPTQQLELACHLNRKE